MKHLDIIVRGKVQGVFFRASAKEVAFRMGVYGFVRNELDGSVFIAAEAESSVLDQFVEWCYRGPDQAKVTAVEVQEGAVKGYIHFEVIRSNF
jgi:acylphosphatase